MKLRLQQLYLGLAAAPLAVIAATCGSRLSHHDGSAQAEAMPEPAAQTGAELYQRYCALCHGKSGEGYVADNANALKNPELLSTAPDSFLRVAIARGRVGTPMSAWAEQYGGPLSGPDIEKLVKLIRSWQTKPSVKLPYRRLAGDPQRGEKLYAEHCADCHGKQGEGNKAPTLDNPIFHTTVSDQFIRYAVAHGRSGTPMPAFTQVLGQQGLDDVTAHVRNLRRGGHRQLAQQMPKVPDVPLIINPKGPPPKFELRDNFYVPAAQLSAALKAGARLVIADARAPSDYLEAHIPGAISLPFYALDDFAAKLPKDGTWIIAYCACPHAASGKVAHGLRDRGFANTAVLDEGIHVWMQQGYPVKKAE